MDFFFTPEKCSSSNARGVCMCVEGYDTQLLLFLEKTNTRCIRIRGDRLLLILNVILGRVESDEKVLRECLAHRRIVFSVLCRRDAFHCV